MDNGSRWEPEDWQLGVVEDLFNGPRELWLIVPQGNGKTTLMGGLALYHADFTPSPWVPIGAASAKQARILYSRAEEFIYRTPKLAERFKPQPGYLRILSKANGGWGIQVYAADKDTGEGIIPTLCLVDEPHAQKDLGLYRTWRGKLRKRQGKIVAISTAGEPGTDFEATRDKIRDSAPEREQLGRCQWRYQSRTIVMHEFRVPSAKDAKDMDLVAAANPLVPKSELEDLFASETLDFGEDWLRKTCNIPARSSNAAISSADWDNAQTDVRIPEGATVSLGADFAWSHDTTAIVPLWMRDSEFRLLGDPIILKPPRDGTMLDPQEVKDAFDVFFQRYTVERVVADKTKAQDTLLWVENERGVEVIDQPQTLKPEILEYEAFMEALRGGVPPDSHEKRTSWLRHTGNTELRSHVMNAIARKVPGDKRVFDRPSQSRTDSKQDQRVIDALKAASMAHLIASANDSAAPFVEAIYG